MVEVFDIKREEGYLLESVVYTTVGPVCRTHGGWCSEEGAHMRLLRLILRLQRSGFTVANSGPYWFFIDNAVKPRNPMICRTVFRIAMPGSKIDWFRVMAGASSDWLGSAHTVFDWYYEGNALFHERFGDACISCSVPTPI